MVSSNEYKIDYCTILEDECIEWNCAKCGVANEENSKKRAEQKEDEIKYYTCFDRTSNIRGFSFNVNTANTIGKLDICTLNDLQNTDIISETSTPYNPVLFGQYQQDLRKLRKYNRLGIPNQTYIKKDFPGAFVWGETVYLIAPKIVD